MKNPYKMLKMRQMRHDHPCLKGLFGNLEFLLSQTGQTGPVVFETPSLPTPQSYVEAI